MKVFNVLIDEKSLFDDPTKNKEETIEKGIRKNHDWATGNLLDYDYFSNRYKLICNNLSKQIELENPNLKQQINFSRKPGEGKGATMFFIIKTRINHF